MRGNGFFTKWQSVFCQLIPLAFQLWFLRGGLSRGAMLHQPASHGPTPIRPSMHSVLLGCWALEPRLPISTACPTLSSPIRGRAMRLLSSVGLTLCHTPLGGERSPGGMGRDMCLSSPSRGGWPGPRLPRHPASSDQPHLRPGDQCPQVAAPLSTPPQ